MMAKALIVTYLIALSISSVTSYAQECAIGPEYWCKSVQNANDCGAVRHCTDTVWNHDKKYAVVDSSTTCQWCQKILENAHKGIEKLTDHQDLIIPTLTKGCDLFPLSDFQSKCSNMIQNYGTSVTSLMKNHRYATLCRLMSMCTEGPMVALSDKQVDGTSDDQQSRMLCNVIVRATHELHFIQQKNQNDIQNFLKKDCQQLLTPELVQQCEDLVNQRGNDIYADVISNKELSRICDYSTAIQPISQVHCDLCTFVLTNTKQMLDAKSSQEKVLLYIDEQLCSRFSGEQQKNCKRMIETGGEALIDIIQRGTQPILVCSYFQVCLHKIITETSPIQKDEMRSFLKENICDHLGPFEQSCNALMERDTTQLLNTLINNVEGDVLCQMFGICPMKMSFIDNLSINDDKNRCKRCIDDFTRRQHIAEKLLNHSSEFLHHLCGQLPQKDECMKAVDEPINKLVDYIRSLNPQDICEELKLCNQTLLEELKSIQISSSDNMISQEVIVYVKNEICTRLGSLSSLCDQIMDTEAKNLFTYMAKYIDPHRVCSVLDICPTDTAFANCDDKCECCVAKVEKYQIQLASFLQTMLTMITGVCERVPGSIECRKAAEEFKSDIDEIIARFNAEQICRSLTHCSSTSVACDINGGDKCTCCQNHFNLHQKNFQTILNEIITTRLSSCTDNDCRTFLYSNHQEILNQIDKISALTYCQRFGLCSSTSAQRSIPFLSHLLTNTNDKLGLADNLCSNFGTFQSICEHLLASRQSDRYATIYMALLHNNSTFIDQDLRKQNANTCDACKNAVQSSKDFWINSLEAVRNALLQTCERCPSKDQCRDYFNQRFDDLKSYLDQIDPEQFCQNIHLCSAVSLTSTCSMCIERLQVRKDGVLQGIDRLTGYFNDLCQRYADKQCQIYAKQVNDMMEKSIEQFDLKETCTSLGFCGTENEKDFDQYEKYLQNEIEKTICSTLGPFEIFCKKVIQGDTKQIQGLKINYDIEDLLQVGEGLNEDISDTEEDECSRDKCHCCISRVMRRKRRTRFIGDSMFFGLIRSCNYCPAKQQCRKHWRMAKARFDCHIDRINPKRVCTHLGFCNQTSIYDSTSEKNCEETIMKADVKEIQENDNSNSTCILCEYVMNILSMYIHRQSTEEGIEQSLQKICNQIPSVLQNQCHDYIDNYGPAIIATLLRDFDLSTICHKLNLCTNQTKIDITHIIKANTATCGICDYISTYLHFALQRNSNGKSLQHALATVCSHLSDEQSSKCQMIVQLFTPQIALLELTPGNNFCKQLTICQTPMIDLKPAILTNRKDEGNQIVPSKNSIFDRTSTKAEENKPALTPKCTLCQYISSYLDAILKNNKSEQAVEEALKKVCTILPGKEHDECEEFVKTYGSTLAELIAEFADPDVICRQIGMCQDSSTKQSTPVLIQTPYTCSICQYMVSRMKHFVSLNQEETEIFASLKDACNLYTKDDLKKQCRDFLDQHGSDFMQIISNDIEPKTACQRIGICGDTYKVSTTAVPVSSSIRYGKCIFGMNYWCISHENAKLCNAVELCEREVWSKRNILIN